MRPVESNIPRGATPQATSESSRSKHERSDIYLPGVMLFVIITAFLMVVIHSGIWGWLKTLNRRPAVLETRHWLARDKPLNQIIEGFPKLQISPRSDWQAYRDLQERDLRSYGWVNRTAGIVRIPIEEAKNQLIEHGLPRRSSNSHLVSPLAFQQSHAAAFRKASETITREEEARNE
jgi:hypothetical protein